jgi:aminoglycoside 6'-N-acetyltransferase
MTLTFRPLTRDDFPLLTAWLEEPRIQRWWNHETSPEAIERDFGPGTRGEEPGEDLVVLLDGRPVGLLQRSVIRDYPDEYERFSAHVDVPPGAVELDYLIGDPDLRGHGLGTRLIRAAVADTWVAHPDAQAVLITVNAANVASWSAVEKAGLTFLTEGDMPPDNPIDDPLHRIHRIDRPADDCSEPFR